MAYLMNKGSPVESVSSKKGEKKRKTHNTQVNTVIRGSDSDNSIETNSFSAESGELRITSASIPLQQKNRNRRKGSEWEVLEGLKDGQRFDRKPDIFNGFLHKKRKWPLKGWHKRYFVVDSGILVYARNSVDISRGRFHGSVDIGLSVISAKPHRRRIDIDAEEFIYHLRAKTHEAFQVWVTILRAHRLYRQHLLTFGSRNPLIVSSGPEENIPSPKCSLEKESNISSLRRKSITLTRENTISWILESETILDDVAKELEQISTSIHHLMQSPATLDTNTIDVNMENLSPNVKKDRKTFGLRKKKSASSKGGSVDLGSTGLRVDGEPQGTLSLTSLSSVRPSSPQNNLSASTHSLLITHPLPLTLATSKPHSLSGHEHIDSSSSTGITPEHYSKEDFTIAAREVTTALKNVLSSLVTEKNKLKTIYEAETFNNSPNTRYMNSSNNAVVALRSNLASALQQNRELKSRLAKIHVTSDITEKAVASENVNCSSHSCSSSCLSASEFYDAEDLFSLDVQIENENIPDTVGDGVIELEGDTSSDGGSVSSENDSLSSENSEHPVDYNVPSKEDCVGFRKRLPAVRPNNEGMSLWNLLCKNIGKDLSQVSMPVTINEPLNMLQRLCEELEYSELLDLAAAANNPVERMMYVVAFAVSAYGSMRYRAGSKPFNPLLGETFEYVRDDKGFRFIAEQVSHHPPISACYAESTNFQFWQEARIRTKFWGKSMEFQPASTVHVLLPATGDLYSWNKVTTCVHNIFGGQRWVDQYGELKITNNQLICKLTFVKASYWFAKRQEVYGSILTKEGKILKKIFGRWSEGLYCGSVPNSKCIWQPSEMPADFEAYYGFTHFAMGLNELNNDLIKKLPCTDTRFRPDQRALEEGNIDKAETLKSELEQRQRERKKAMDDEKEQYVPRWFRKTSNEKGEEYWQFNGKYWEIRENPGFSSMNIEPLW